MARRKSHFDDDTTSPLVSFKCPQLQRQVCCTLLPCIRCDVLGCFRCAYLGVTSPLQRNSTGENCSHIVRIMRWFAGGISQRSTASLTRYARKRCRPSPLGQNDVRCNTTTRGHWCTGTEDGGRKTGAKCGARNMEHGARSICSV